MDLREKVVRGLGNVAVANGGRDGTSCRHVRHEGEARNGGADEIKPHGGWAEVRQERRGD